MLLPQILQGVRPSRNSTLVGRDEISGLSVTIWRNHSERGYWYSVNPKRSFKSGDDGWRETESLGFDDLLTMAKLLDQAHTYIANQMKADAKARKEAGPTAR